jgi:uncharacterized protein
MARKFLTAKWSNLILANYAVPEALLRPLLPPGVELDRRDGECWASLVGFQFLETRVLGISWPGFRNFPEWNLRFYVTHQGRRGVCFVREFVPQWLIATVARAIYNEPYRATRMTESITQDDTQLSATYGVKFAGRMHTMTATGQKPAITPEAKSDEAFFKEHSWGYGVTHFGRLLRYEVNHPEWPVYPVTHFQSDVDWGLMYGPEWAVMNTIQPASVILAVGSDVSVYPHGKA